MTNDLARVLRLSRKGFTDTKSILEAVSDFIEAQKFTVGSLTKMAETAKCNQREIILTVKEIVSSLDLLCCVLKETSKEVHTEEARTRLSEISVELGKLGVELSSVLEKVNKSNNGFWKIIVTGTMLILGSIGMIIVKADDGNKIPGSRSESE